MKTNRQQGNVVTGILIGIVVAVLALGGAYFFFSKQKPKYENLEKNTALSEKTDGLSSSNVEVLTPKGAENAVEFRPSDKITNIPPVIEVPIDKEDSTQTTVQPGQTTTGNSGTNTSVDTSPPIKPNSVKEPTKVKTPDSKKDDKIKPITRRSFLQVGSFKDGAQAEEQKAQLALLGFQSEIQKIDLGKDKGVYHRVRVGPFTNDSQLQKTQKTLKSNNIKADVVSAN